MQIFLSYRRSDSKTITGRLWQQLCSEFGRDRVFFDHHSLPLGRDFPGQIAAAIDASDAVLVVMGPTWTSTTSAGVRRLDQPEDHVRREIELALAGVDVVIPVLVDGASVPPPSELPETIRPLSFRTAVQLRDDPDFESDMARLTARLRLAVSLPAPSPEQPAKEVDPCQDAGEAGRVTQCLDLAGRRVADATDARSRLVAETVLGRWRTEFLRCDQAAAGLRDALSRHALPPEDPALLRAQAAEMDAIVRSVDAPVALELVGDLLDRCTAHLGPGDPATLSLTVQRQAALLYTGRGDLVARQATAVVDDIAHFGGPGAWSSIRLQLQLAECLLADGDAAMHAVADTVLAAAPELARAGLGAEHPLTRLADGLYVAREAMADPAATALASAVRRAAQSCGRRHPTHLRLLLLQRRAMAGHGSDSLAAVDEDLLELLTATAGADEGITLTYLDHVGGHRERAGDLAAALELRRTLLARRRLRDGRGASRTLAAAASTVELMDQVGTGNPGNELRIAVEDAADLPAGDRARIYAETLLAQFAEAAGDARLSLQHMEQALSGLESSGPLDPALATLRRTVRNLRWDVDDLAGAMAISRLLIGSAGSPGEPLDPHVAGDLAQHGLLLWATSAHAEAVNFWDRWWPSLEPLCAPADPLSRVLSLARLTSGCFAGRSTPLQALVSEWEQLLPLPDADLDASHRLGGLLALNAALITTNRLQPGSREARAVAADVLSACSRRILADARFAFVDGARLAFAAAYAGAQDSAIYSVGGGDPGLPAFKVQEMTANGQQWIADPGRRRSRVAADIVAALPAHDACPLDTAAQREATLRLAHAHHLLGNVWPAALLTARLSAKAEARDEVPRLGWWNATYVANTGSELGWAAQLLHEQVWLVARNGGALADRPQAQPQSGTVSRPDQVGLLRDHADEGLNAAVALAVVFLRQAVSAAPDSGRLRLGAELLAHAVRQFDLLSEGLDVLGDGGWVDNLDPLAFPRHVLGALRAIDGQLSEVSGGRLGNGRELPPAYRQLAERTAAAAVDGSLFGR